MKRVKLVDVTLRDGGYKTNFHFKKNSIKHIIACLDQAGVEYIEIGYRNGPFKSTNNMGDAAYCRNEYIEFCSSYVTCSKLTVMLHPNNISQIDIDELEHSGVKAVRLCFSPQYKQSVLNTLQLLQDYHFDVFINMTRVSQYSNDQLLEWACEFSQFRIKAIYLADSNGGLVPSQITPIFLLLNQHTHFPLGFHAHDNLSLAQANAIAALDAGAQYLDSSLHGLGKGGGNLRTEFIATFLNNHNNHHYDVCSLIDTAELMPGMVGVPTGRVSAKDVIHGIFNLSQDDIVRLDDCADTHVYYSRARKFSEEKILK